MTQPPKQTGMMFQGPLVRAILEGRKTQTRRLVKPTPESDQPLQYITTETGLVYARSMGKIESQNPRRIRWDCPVGKPGDLIYVRETHAHHTQFPQMAFRADGEEFEDADGFLWHPKWTPAIHMKKVDARIWLEITGVRVERLQDISRGDAMAEGCPFSNMAKGPDPREWFAEVWNATGGAWSFNPWVWVYEFKRVATPAN